VRKSISPVDVGTSGEAASLRVQNQSGRPAYNPRIANEEREASRLHRDHRRAMQARRLRSVPLAYLRELLVQTDVTFK